MFKIIKKLEKKYVESAKNWSKLMEKYWNCKVKIDLNYEKNRWKSLKIAQTLTKMDEN